MSQEQQLEQRLDRVFMALADSTRRRIVHMLANADLTVSELAEPFSMSLAAVSKHIKVLERAGLVTRRTEWREHIIELNMAPLRQIDLWFAELRSIWALRLEALEDIFNEETANDDN